ncbi:forkhead-associated domain-containing family protein [Salix suchowensis]|nr:forkhead-associated domain-containing family protein [Salix suchowensis]
MANNKEKRPGEEVERKIPVFTVLRNGAILKNIFVVSKSPLASPTSSEPSIENEESIQETEEILTFGRHPDCNIVLNHPSISRFHLQINSKPSSQKLFVTDLSSVHGTWISGRKIEPGLRVELNEGDTIKVGGSTRYYRLLWVPMSRAYDMETPFISPSDMTMIEEKREENLVFEEENEVKMSQDENLMATERESFEEKGSLEVAGKDDIKYQAMDSISVEIRETQPLDLILQDVGSLYCDEICESIARKEISLVPDESMDSLFYDANEDIESSFRNDHQVRDILSPKCQQYDEHNQSPEYFSFQQELSETEIKGSSMIGESNAEFFSTRTSLSTARVEAQSASEMLGATENGSLLRKGHEPINYFSLGIEMVSLCLPVKDLSENDIKKVRKENQNLELDALESSCKVGSQENFTANLLVNLNSACSDAQAVALDPTYEEGTRENFTANLMANLNTACSDDHAVALDPTYEEGTRENFTENLLACSDDHDATDVLEVESHNLSRDDRGQSEYTSICSALLAEESVSSSFPVGFLSDIIDGKKCQTPESVLASIENQENLQSSHVGPEKKLSSHNIWSRRGKPKAVLQLQTIRSRENNRGADVEWENQDYIEKRSISNTIFPGSEAAEEILTPGKENYSPNTLLMKSLKKKGKREETQLSNSRRSTSSKTTFSPYMQQEEEMVASPDKENQRPLKFLQQASKNQVKFKQEMVLEECKAERVPLQSLLANFSGNSISVRSDATRSDISVNCSHIMRKSNFAIDGRRRWTMVADTASLVDKESRKSLQLLQGLKGTHLVIPKMVIRELDCLKRRSSLFRRKTEASMLLEWIEECMVRTPWWIHVQSSVEEGRHIAPTPPASPPSRFSQGSEGFPCGSGSSVPFPAHGSLLEIVSPTAEDHILEYALSYRKMNRDGQLILLSNDVTLKIKAMAEGLICETAKEFRDSLVNPFSERFLWADSSPRGLTWSVSDDLVLKDRYYRSPSKKSSKGEGAKGLKLILLHNSQYGQISQSEQVSLFRNK